MDIVIIGAGGHGKVVLDILHLANQVNPVGFIDADPALAGTMICGLPVLGAINMLPKLRGQKIKAAIVAIGDNRIRPSYAKMVQEAGLDLINAIHPAAFVSPTATLGKNVVIAAGAVVSTEAKIADSVIINTSATVDHECEIGPAAHICPGARIAGRVRIGAGAFIGTGAIIIPCLSIGEHTMIAAGAVVIRDIPPYAVVMGVPAKVVKIRPPQPTD